MGGGSSELRAREIATAEEKPTRRLKRRPGVTAGRRNTIRAYAAAAAAAAAVFGGAARHN